MLALERGQHFGPDIVFTYGALGFLVIKELSIAPRTASSSHAKLRFEFMSVPLSGPWRITESEAPRAP